MESKDDRKEMMLTQELQNLSSPEEPQLKDPEAQLSTKSDLEEPKEAKSEAQIENSTQNARRLAGYPIFMKIIFEFLWIDGV